MKIRYDVISETGNVRSNNEDMALIFGAFIRDDSQRSMVPMRSRPRFTALVADGMGGYGGGEIASEMTLRSFNTFIGALPHDLTPREVIQSVKEWFKANQDEVLMKAASSPDLNQMGSTLTGIFTYGSDEYMLNAGDSRVYRWRYDTLRQLSTDHSERQRTGDPSVPSNLIYNAVGVPGAFVDVTNLSTEMPVIDGDTYVICSDGLSDMIPDDKIAEILAAGGGARELVDAALLAGGNDNCTVIVLHISIPEPEENHEETHLQDVQEVPDGSEGTAGESENIDFTIDETEESVEQDGPLAPAETARDMATPPPLPPEYTQAPVQAEYPVTDDYEEITEEEAANLPPATPTQAERIKATTHRIRDAWQTLLGKKQ